jgi:hypothetical protein
VVKRAPAHARGLRLSERLAFVAMFALMAAFVVGLTVLAVKSGNRAVTGRTAPASSRTLPAGVAQLAQLAGGTGHSGTGQTGTGKTGASQTGASQTGAGPAGTGVTRSASATLGERLAASLRAAVSSHLSQLSVGVIDTATGAKALYHGSEHYHTASIAKADILAAMLYLDQRAPTSATARDSGLAAEMIDQSSDAAATRLWTAIGGGPGMAVANKALKLRQTIPGPAASWGLTRTTVADQLQLLTDLTAGTSALGADGRNDALGLLSDGMAAQQWGVSAAASPGTAFAVTDGWLRDPRLWLVGSIGVIRHDGHELLIAVLSKGNPTEADGIRAVRAAAIAAAGVIMTAAS